MRIISQRISQRGHKIRGKLQTENKGRSLQAAMVGLATAPCRRRGPATSKRSMRFPGIHEIPTHFELLQLCRSTRATTSLHVVTSLGGQRGLIRRRVREKELQNLLPNADQHLKACDTSAPFKSHSAPKTILPAILDRLQNEGGLSSNLAQPLVPGCR